MDEFECNCGKQEKCGVFLDTKNISRDKDVCHVWPELRIKICGVCQEMVQKALSERKDKNKE